MFLRLIKNILYQQRQVETLRQTLFSHRAFNVREAFEVIDKNKSGSITEEEIASIFESNSIDTREPNRIIALFGCDKDKTMNFIEFSEMVTPKSLPFKNMVGGGYGSVEERRLQQLSWLESLNDLFLGILRAEDDLEYYKEKYQLDGERIFQDIDSLRAGYFYINKFANWVSQNCGFTILNEDLPYVQEGLNGGRSHIVNKDVFLKRVNPNPNEEAVVSEQAVPESDAGEAEAEEEQE